MPNHYNDDPITNIITQVLRKVFTHTRDVSMRDGGQSWDANQWKIEDILSVLKEINKLARIVQKYYDINMNPNEVWGGGQVAQPALFLKENPLNNLSGMHKIAPNLTLQCLYRGRQCFGFIPVSADVQQEAIKLAADRGMKEFRIFDMMNDISNVKTGIEAVKQLRKSDPIQYNGLKIEGAISYISEPEGKRAWELKDYADYAVEMAKLGVDEIVIKNYAGVGDDEMPALVDTIREALNQAGFQHININLHSHGQKPEHFVDMIEQHKVGKVDTAFGELAGGPSHTNIRDIINLYLEQAGIQPDNDQVKNHPIMQQITVIENKIHEIVNRRDIKPANGNNGESLPYESFNDRRTGLKNLTRDDIERYRIAAGSFSDFWNRIKNDRNFERLKHYTSSKDDLLHKMLNEATVLWEKGGRFNTVTPGSLILAEQVSELMIKKQVLGKELTMADYTKKYMDVVTGRYGLNRGIEKDIGNAVGGGKAFRDALLMYQALSKMQEELTTEIMQDFLVKASIGSKGHRLVAGRDGKVDLKHTSLEGVLKQTDINKFKKAVNDTRHIPEALKAELQAILTPGRSKDPDAGVDVGVQHAKNLLGDKAASINADELQALGTLAMILTREKNPGEFDRSVFDGMVAKQYQLPAPKAELALDGYTSTAHAQQRVVNS